MYPLSFHSFPSQLSASRSGCLSSRWRHESEGFRELRSQLAGPQGSRQTRTCTEHCGAEHACVAILCTLNRSTSACLLLSVCHKEKPAGSELDPQLVELIQVLLTDLVSLPGGVKLLLDELHAASNNHAALTFLAQTVWDTSTAAVSGCIVRSKTALTMLFVSALRSPRCVGEGSRRSQCSHSGQLFVLRCNSCL